jgi:hypothetical protein
MSSDVSLQVLYKIANAAIQPFPYPHIYVRDVFPADFYQEIRRQLPPKETFKTLKALGRVGSGYPDTRFVLPFTPDSLGALEEPQRGFWSQMSDWMLGGTFGQMMLGKFGGYVEQRFGERAKTTQFQDEALLVQDYTTYSLGPHTDTPIKVLSFLFYLPPDDSLSHLGTSIYVPKDPQFMCAGGPHHPFEKFRRMVTMPYLPNTLFAFLKADNSFHGVEPITDAEVRRDLLLYDIKVQKEVALGKQPAAAPAGAAAPAKFSF